MLVKGKTLSLVIAIAYVFFTPGYSSLPSGTFHEAPQPFIQNQGQLTDAEGKPLNQFPYYTRQPGLDMYLHPSGPTFILKPEQGSFYRTDMRLDEADMNAKSEAEGPSDEKLNFYYPHCPRGIVGVQAWSRIRFRNVKPGVDWVWYEKDGQIEYDFVFADVNAAQSLAFTFEGAQSIRVQSSGQLEIITPAGTITQSLPRGFLTYQGGMEEVNAHWETEGNRAWIHWNRSLRACGILVIDPVLSWSTFAGGTSGDFLQDVAPDSTGFLWATGHSAGSGFPISAGAWQTVNNGTDVVVMKFDLSGRRIFSTYLGGSVAGTDQGFGIATDASGNGYVVGNAGAGFPTTTGVYQTTNTGGGTPGDAFLAKFDALGNRVWASYYTNCSLRRVTWHPNGSLSAAGSTSNAACSTSVGAFQTVLGGNLDALVTNFNATTGTRNWATFAGGTLADEAYGITSDPWNNLILVGKTASNNFPVSAGAFQAARASNPDGFIFRFRNNGTRAWSTYYGGTAADFLQDVTTDGSGRIYACGTTLSNGMSTAGVIGTTTAAGSGTVIRFDSAGTRSWATYCGTAVTTDSLTGIAVDKSGVVYVTGTGRGAGLPVTVDAIKTTSHNNAILLYLNNTATARIFCSYFGNNAGGANNYDFATGLALDTLNGVTVSGYSTASAFPTTTGALQTTYAGNTDGFLFRLACMASPVITSTPVSPGCTATGMVLDAGAGYTSYAWNTGATTRTITVFTSGTYSCTTGSGGGCLAWDTITVTLQPPLNPGFVFTTSTNNRLVTFSDTTSGTHTVVKWDFGNGMTGVGFNTSHTYSADGNYNVCLIVNNGCGNDTICRTVTITCTLPVSNFTWTDDANFTLHFTNLSTYPGVIPPSYTWDFGDASFSGLTNPSHAYAGGGSYNVCLRVLHTCGADTLCQNAYVLACHPIGGNFYSMVNGMTVCFNDTARTFNNSWLWTFGDGDTSRARSPLHTYRAPGSYNVCLTSSNYCDTAVFCRVICVEALDADFSTFVNGNTVNFTNLSTGPATAYLWDFGDGTTATGRSTSHTYPSNGTWQVCLTISSGCGSHTQCYSVTTGCDPGYSFTPQWSWATSTPNEETSEAVTVDNAKAAYIAGIYSTSVTFGANTLNAVAGTDGYVTKFDSLGNVRWAKGFPGNGVGGEKINDVLMDPLGRLLVVGSFSGTMNLGTLPSLVSAGGTDIFIARMDTSGTFRWARRFGSTLNDEATAVEADATGRIYLTGSFQGSVLFGSQTLVSAGMKDVFIARLDSGGLALFAERGGGAQDDESFDVALDATGNAVIGGYYFDAATFSSIGIVPDCNGTTGFVAKYDPYLTPFAFQEYGQNGTSAAVNCIRKAPAGGHVIAGTFNGTLPLGNDTLISVSGALSDFFVIRVNEMCGTQWTKVMGSTAADDKTDIALSPSGRVLVAANLNGSAVFNGASRTPTGTLNAALWGISPDGEEEFFEAYPGQTFSNGTSVVWTGNQSAWLTGNFRGNMYIQDDTLLNPSTTVSNVFLTRLGQTAPTAPVAGFRFTVASDSVYFTDTTSGIVTQFFWDFGDGTNSTAQNPRHHFASPGTYVVCLTAFNGCLSDTLCQRITVDCNAPAVTPSITYTTNGFQVNFTGSSTGNVTGWFWNFGDGSTSNIQNPSHTYSTQAPWLATLTTTSGCGTRSVRRLVNMNCISREDTVWTYGYDTGLTGSPTSRSSVDFLAKDAFGNHFCAGSYLGTINNPALTSSSNATEDAWVSKFNSSRNLQWTVPFRRNANGSVQITAFHSDEDGYTYIAGKASGSNVQIGSTTLNANPQSVFLTRLSPTGNVDWVLQENEGGEIHSLSLEGDFVYAGGTMNSFFDFGNGVSLTASRPLAANRGFVTKFTRSGQAIWATEISDGAVWEIATDAGRIVITGSFSGTLHIGGFTLSDPNLVTNAGASFLAAMTTGGSISWARPFDVSQTSEAQLELQTNQDIVWAGNYSQSANFNGTVLNAAGGTDMFFARYDANGILSWAKGGGSSGNDRLASAMTGHDGLLYLTGNTAGAGSIAGVNLLHNAASNDFVAVADASGSVQTITESGNRVLAANTAAANDVMFDLSGNLLSAGKYIGDYYLDSVRMASADASYKGYISAWSRSFRTVQAQFSHSTNLLTLSVTDQTPGFPTNWTWNWGDGNTSAGQNPGNHTYSNPGTYNVCLIVTESCATDTTCVAVTVCAPPVAAFTETRGPGNGAITFSNTSVYGTTYNWNFGDGNMSAAASPVHTYLTPGTFNACLITGNSCGADTTCDTVLICLPPVSSFTWVPNNGSYSIPFTSTSQYAAAWSWNFGDGQTSTQQNPVHAYSAPGTYNVCLTTTNGCGTQLQCSTVTVNCVRPDAGWSSSAAALSVTFTDTSHWIPTAWSWNFGDGQTSTQQNPTHLYSGQGSYNVCLIISNACGADTQCQRISVICNPPTAGFSSASNLLTTTFTNTSLNSSTYAWNFGDGQSSTQQNPVHVFAAPGTYNVCLISTNVCGADTFCQSVTVVCPLPSATWTYSANLLAVSFTNGSNGATSYQWNFGDGQSSLSTNPAHTYALPGTYNVCLIAINSCGNDTLCQSLTVVCPQSVPGYTFTTSGLNANFTNTSSNAVSYQWRFGDGTTSTAANPLHSFPAPGSYTVCLYSTNSCGTDSVCRVVTVNCTGPTSGFSSSNNQLTVTFINTSLNGTSWQWDFGDGNTSVQQNEIHTYASPGTYSVCLYTTNACGSDTFCAAVTVACSAPAAAFTQTANQLQVTFTNNSTGGISYNWNFGDGTNTNQPSPVHTFFQPGTYNVCLIGDNGCGSDTICQSVTVNCTNLTGNYNFTVNGLNAAFTNTSVGATRYVWFFGDGTTSGQASPVHAYNAAGVYSVCLIASNACRSDTVCRNVSVTCGMVFSSFTPTVNQLSVSFANLSMGGTQYQWSFGDGNASSAFSPVHNYPAPGNYNVCLIIDGGCGTDTTCQTVTTTCGAVTSAFNTSANQLEVTFTNASLSATGYLWQFGDGTSSTSANPVHNYPSPGTYHVCLIASSPCGADTTCATVTVSCGIVNSAFWYSGNQLSVTFSNQSTGGSSYLWQFGDGTTSTAFDTVHAYASPGTYNVCLIVSSGCGADTFCQRVTTTCGRVTAAYTYVPAQLTVAFTDQSNAATRVFWQFGDGATSTLPNPTHAYQSAGTYNVCLIASSNCGDDTLCRSITVSCGFVYAAYSATTAQLTTSFTNLSNGATTYHWDFGDGDTSNVMHPQHAYAGPGTYNVCLIASSPCGSDTLCRGLTITCGQVYPSFSFSTNELEATFANTSAGATGYSWDFGDGTSSTQANPMHTYPQSGTYNVCLIATNGCSTDTVCQPVIVTCSAPLAGYSVSLNNLIASFSSTSVNATSLTWDFGDGNSSTLSQPSHVYASSGNYNVCLIAANSCGTDTLCQGITVICPLPSGGFTYSLNALSAQFTDTTRNGTVASWDFGDGQISTQQNPSHNFSAAGSYNVCQIVQNGCGRDTNCILLTVTCTAPQAGFTFTRNNLAFSFTSTSTGNPTQYSWTFGDGGTSNQPNPGHAYATGGNYVVCLTVSNSCSTSQICDTLTVTSTEELPLKDFAVYPNPNMGRFTVEGTFLHSVQAGWKIESMTGVKVAERAPESYDGNFRIEFSLTHVSVGIYILILESEGKIFRYRVVKE